MDALLTLKDLKEKLRISYPTISRMMYAGKFPQPVNGRRNKLLWTQKAVEEWMNQSSNTAETLALPVVKKKGFRKQQELTWKMLREHGITPETIPAQDIKLKD